MSPTIHFAGFAHYDLPHTYEIYQMKTVEGLGNLIKSPDFGGASVTMPHKLAITMHCSEVSRHAEIIGAVNTLIRDGTKECLLFEENTDWMDLASLFSKEARNLCGKFDTGLVIGAGGASRAALYALYKSGIEKIYLFNRTRSRAEDIAQNLKAFFKVIVLDQLDDITTNEAPHVIISTVPADKTSVALFLPVMFS
jgi:shikimate 5-dehydrogenase